MRSLLACISLLLLAQAAFATLPAETVRALHTANIPLDAVSAWVGPAAGTSASWQQNGDKPVNPASVMKLLTTYAGLELLGPSFSWRTDALMIGPIEQGVLLGDIVIRGSGDPSLTWDKLSAWLRDWRAKGLREIRGDILIDRSLFPSEAASRDFDGAPQRAYNAAPDAFLVNFSALSLLISPGDRGYSPQVNGIIPAAPMRIRNDIRLIDGPCADWRNAIRATIAPEAQGLLVQLEGSFARDCGERVLHVNVADSVRWGGSVLRALWQEQGGVWPGNVRGGTAPAGLQPFSSWQSPPLAEVLRNMNKFSNNVMARHVFLTLGANTATGSASVSQTAERLTLWMRARGLAPGAWNFENGSGLSRLERTTATQLGALLRSAWQSPRMPDFVSALPILGVDGTMHSRMIDTPESGRGYIKTGTLEGVKAAAGYVLDAKGRWQAFAFIVNHPRAASAEAALETLIKAIYEAP